MRTARRPDELRPVRFTRRYSRHAEGSVLVEFGDTRVLCTASLEERVPPFLKGQGQGWITAEYGMLPRATHERTPREAARGKQGGRTLEIQRLIGRSLRAAVDLKRLGERTLTFDCDVIQADGGTRTAAITGAWVALWDALAGLRERGLLDGDDLIAQVGSPQGGSPPVLRAQVAAVSVGISDGEAILDLDYAEDSSAHTDMNLVMDNEGRFIEVQGTAEGVPFTRPELDGLLELGAYGIRQLLAFQREALGLPV